MIELIYKSKQVEMFLSLKMTFQLYCLRDKRYTRKKVSASLREKHFQEQTHC